MSRTSFVRDVGNAALDLRVLSFLANNDHGVTVMVMTAMVMAIRLCISRDRKEGDESK
jgi:hypothetical protein